jgi:hypothetical protein
VGQPSLRERVRGCTPPQFLPPAAGFLDEPNRGGECTVLRTRPALTRAIAKEKRAPHRVPSFLTTTG